MTPDTIISGWFMIGVLYFCVNIFIRKLHLKNSPEMANWLVPVWVFLWPMCWLAILVGKYFKWKRKLF